MNEPFDPPRGPVSAERPTALTVAAVFAWVWGGLMATCLPCNCLSVMLPGGGFPGGGAAGANPMLAVYEAVPWFRSFTLVTSGVGILIALVLIARGVGLWKLRPWGWVLCDLFAVVSLLQNAAGTTVNFLYVFPAMRENLSGPAAQGGLIGGMAGGVCGAFLGLLVPVVLLVLIHTGAAGRARQSG